MLPTAVCVCVASDSRAAVPGGTGSHQAVWGNQSWVLGRVGQVRWASVWMLGALSLSSTKKKKLKNCKLFKLSNRCSGDGVKDFFFRVASLTFEANVLSELEKGGSRDVSDIISESNWLQFILCLIFRWYATRTLARSPGNVLFKVLSDMYTFDPTHSCSFLAGLTDNTDVSHRSASKKSNCCWRTWASYASRSAVQHGGNYSFIFCAA